MEELGLGPNLEPRVSDDYVKGVVACSPPLNLGIAHNPPKQQLTFSVFAVVIDKIGSTLVTISDLISTGSTERKLLLQGEAKTRTLEIGDVLLLLNPMGDKTRLTVNSTRNLMVIAKLPDLGNCSSGKCQKPIIKARDGNVCWQHAINATTAANIRTDTAGGVLLSTKKPQIKRIMSSSMPTAQPTVVDPKKAKIEALEARKKGVLWMEERTRNQRDARDLMMNAAKASVEPEKAGDCVLVKAGDDELEIEFENDPRKSAPAMCEMILPALPPVKEVETRKEQPDVEEPPLKKKKPNNESLKLALPSFSSDSEGESNNILAFNEAELEQLRANYR